MRFLVYDENKQHLQELHELLESLSVDFQVDTVAEYEQFLELFSLHVYNIIFIDISDDISKQIVTYIQENKPRQKLAVLSDTFEYLDEQISCTSCKDSYDTIRIAKPFRHEDFFFLVENKPCSFDFTGSRLVAELMCITKKYKAFKIDIEKLQISYGKFYSTSLELIELCDDLRDRNISFELHENNYIQVIDKTYLL